LTFANTTAENAMLAAQSEDVLVNGGFSNGRSVTLAGAIGDITAGEYAITDIDAASRTIDFAFTAGNNSGSGSFTINFYENRIPGSTTTARLYEATARSLVSANDADGEEIAGLRRRDRGQQITGSFSRNSGTGVLVNDTALAGAFSISSTSYANRTVTEVAQGYELDFDSADSPNARTGTTTDPRALVGHVYIHGRTYSA